MEEYTILTASLFSSNLLRAHQSESKHLAPFLHFSNLTTPSLLIRLVVEIPGVSDHEFKVLVVVDARPDVGVVFNKLLGSYLTVFIFWVFQRVMQLKCVKELRENLFLGLDSLLHIRMLLGVVCALDVSDVEDSRVILIDLLKRFHYESLSNGAHFTGNSSHKLVVGDLSVLIEVEEVE